MAERAAGRVGVKLKLTAVLSLARSELVFFWRAPCFSLVFEGKPKGNPWKPFWGRNILTHTQV